MLVFSNISVCLPRISGSIDGVPKNSPQIPASDPSKGGRFAEAQQLFHEMCTVHRDRHCATFGNQGKMVELHQNGWIGSLAGAMKTGEKLFTKMM